VTASKALAVLALLAALAAAGYLGLADTYRHETCFVEATGTRCVSGASTLIEENGAWVALILAVPVAVTALGLVLAVQSPAQRPARWVLAAAFFLLCLLTGFTIGLFFLPAALLSVLSVVVDRPRRDTDHAA
jgi:hypothetical protein